MTGIAVGGGVVAGYFLLIAAGSAPVTFGIGTALAGSIAAIVGFISAVILAVAWIISQFNSITIPIPKSTAKKYGIRPGNYNYGYGY